MRHLPPIALGAIAALSAILPGCTTEPARPGTKAASLAACSTDAIETCEAALASAVDDGRDVTDALAAYAKARASADPAVGEALERLRARRGGAVVVRIAGAKVTTSLPTVDVASAPKPKSISETELWVAIAEASNVGFLAVVRPDGSVARYFPHDPLRPMMGALPAGVVDPKAPNLDADAKVEEALRAASSAAKAFDYVKAADAIDRLDALLEGRDPFDAVTLRGQVFSNALALSRPAPSSTDDKPTPPKPDGPAPAAYETPYLDLLRVRMDRRSIEWPRRRERIVAAFPQDRRDAIRALYDPSPGCTFAPPPDIAREGDLLFASLLSRSLLPSRAKAPLGRVPLEVWYPRYAAFLDTVERTGNGWLELGLLMTERGQSSGIVPAGAEVHKRATALALKHARALKLLADQRPGRVGVGQVGFFLAPGNLLDEPVRKEVVDLTQIAARTNMNQAKEPGEVAIAALTGVLGGMQMPPDLREAHFTALQAAFTAKLRGELGKKTGWGMALLHVLDGSYRTAFDQAPNLKATAEAVSFALETDPKIEQPGLASLTASIARYVALAADQGLGTAIPEGKDLLPGRAQARASLERAIASLGDGDGAPRELSKNVADLADETIATVALAIAAETKKPDGAKADAKKGERKADAKNACSSGPQWTPDPKTRRSLDKLRDLRRKILSDKAFTTGDGAWVKRARLVVLLLSDAIDVASDTNLPAPRFAISDADGERYVKTALDGWVPYAGVGDTLAGSFAAYRGLMGKGKDFFLGAQGATALRKVLSGLGAFFASDTSGTIEGAELLTLLAPKAGRPEAELVPVLIDVARDLYAHQKAKQADMLLLATLVVTQLRKVPPLAEAVKLAQDNHSHALWALEFARELSEGSRGEPMHADAFVPDLKAAVTDACGIASVDDLGAVIAGMDDFRAGRRKEGRAKLEKVLTEARDKAFTVPRFSFAFQQETKSRAMSLTIELGLGSGLLSGANTFSVGAGAKTAGEPTLKLAVTVDNPDVKRALDDTARYYIATSALAGVYHFLDGDVEAGEIAAARTLGAATQRTWLGVPGVTDDPTSWSADARGTLAVLAELAAESGRPLLAGDLLSLVKASLGSAADKETVKGMLDPVPLGLVGIKDLGPIIDRTRTLLDETFSQQPCVHAKDITSKFEKAQCGDYPTALALRVADSVHVLPTLSAGPKGQAGACPDLAALDGFLVPAQKETYEPDKFLDAVGHLAEAGKSYDAAVLLTKHRRPDHCSAAVTEKISALADKMKGAPVARADLLSALVNCTTGAPPPEVARSLGVLDEELLKVGDPMRSAQLSLFAAALTLKTGSSEPLAAVALRPGFLDRWRRQNPEVLTVALAIDHAASILAGKPVKVDETARDFALLCSESPPADRAQLCKLVGDLRAKGSTPDELKKSAKDVLGMLVPNR
jgi:hypothetical protein